MTWRRQELPPARRTPRTSSPMRMIAKPRPFPPAEARIPRQGKENSVIQQSVIQAASAAGSCLYVGQDRFGRWVVRDADCRCGGLFTNQTEAIRFAMYECQRRPSPSSCCQTASNWTAHSPSLQLSGLPLEPRKHHFRDLFWPRQDTPGQAHGNVGLGRLGRGRRPHDVGLRDRDRRVRRLRRRLYRSRGRWQNVPEPRLFSGVVS